MSHSVPKTLFTFPYLSPRPSSPNLLPALLKLGHGAQLHPPPHLAALCHCYRSVRTRPSQTALSSEANTNQPQMFTLGEKGQQMRSHSIKLASIPTLPLSLSLFLTLSASLQSTLGNSLDMWVWQLWLYFSHSQLSFFVLWVTWVSPCKKKKAKNTHKKTVFQFFKPLAT